MKNTTLALLLPFYLCFNGLPAMAQDDVTEEEEATPAGSLEQNKGFHVGFYIGAYFPNKHSANIYDGYGFDVNGKKNSFSNSLMYRKIVQENDPAITGYNDRVAEALGVPNHSDWRFDETDMPINMKYNVAFQLGIELQYGLNKKESILLNLNFAKLTASGNFTIRTINPGTSNTFPNLQTFGIIGSEQRTLLQLGYSRILGNNDKMNFFVEAGLCMNYSKFLKNTIQINSLTIDLTDYTQIQGYPVYQPLEYNGWGIGGFAGFGVNISASAKYTVQFLYTPSYETINLGEDTKPALQHSAGLRAYYNF